MVYKVKEETITEIANAIRAKTNLTGDIKVQNFAEEILNIKAGENTISAEKSARDAEASAISAKTHAQFAADCIEQVAADARKSEAFSSAAIATVTDFQANVGVSNVFVVATVVEG